MNLIERIEKEYIEAYKAKNSDKLSVLRLLKSSIKNLQIDLKRDLTDDEAFKILFQQVKQRQDSIEQFSKAGRTDLADKEQKELSILNEYMPPQLSDEELSKVVNDCIKRVNATSMKDMRDIMSIISTEYRGMVDSKRAGEFVKRALSG